MTFSLLLSVVAVMLKILLFAEYVYGAGPEAGLGWMRAVYRVAAGVLSTPVVILLGVPLARRALGALRERRWTMDVLVAAGAVAAYVVSIVSIVRGRGG